MNFGLSFGYVFQDDAWFKKLILPAVCLLIPIIGWMIALGWALRVTQNVIAGESHPLPDLNFGDDLLKGFFVFLIGFIYSLPVELLSVVSGWIGGINFLNFESGRMITTLFAGGLGLIAFLLGLLTSFLSLAAVANYAAKGNLGAAFRLNEVFDLLKNNFVGWLVAALGTILAVGIIGPLGTLACIIGVILTLTYGMAVMGHLLGQAYLRSNQTPDA